MSLSRHARWIGWVVMTILTLSCFRIAQSGQETAAELLKACEAAIEEPNVALAIESCQRAVNLDPALIEAYVLLGRILVNNEHYERAVELLQRAKQRAPDHPNVRLWLVTGLFYWEHCPDAVREGQDALSRLTFRPEERASVLYFVGKCLQTLGQFQVATRVLEEATQIELSARPILFERDDLSRYIDQALVLAYWRYLELAPQDHEARLRLAKVLLRRSDILGTQGALRAILDARPTWGEPHYWLGQVLLRLARDTRNAELAKRYFAEARQAFEAYIRLEPQGEYAEETRLLLLQIPRL